MPAGGLSSPPFFLSSSAAVGLLAAHGALSPDTEVKSGGEGSEDRINKSLPSSPSSPPAAPLRLLVPPGRSCLEPLGVTVQPRVCCPLVWE